MPSSSARLYLMCKGGGPKALMWSLTSTSLYALNLVRKELILNVMFCTSTLEQTLA